MCVCARPAVVCVSVPFAFTEEHGRRSLEGWDHVCPCKGDKCVGQFFCGRSMALKWTTQRQGGILFLLLLITAVNIYVNLQNVPQCCTVVVASFFLWGARAAVVATPLGLITTSPLLRSAEGVVIDRPHTLSSPAQERGGGGIMEARDRIFSAHPPSPPHTRC